MDKSSWLGYPFLYTRVKDDLGIQKFYISTIAKQPFAKVSTL